MCCFLNSETGNSWCSCKQWLETGGNLIADLAASFHPGKLQETSMGLVSMPLKRTWQLKIFDMWYLGLHWRSTTKVEKTVFTIKTYLFNFWAFVGRQNVELVVYEKFHLLCNNFHLKSYRKNSRTSFEMCSFFPLSKVEKIRQCNLHKMQDLMFASI